MNKSFTYKIPFILSIVSSYTGTLLYLFLSNSSNISLTSEFISTANTSVLCFITSETTLSLNSNTLFIISFSSSSIVPSSSPASTKSLISSSVTISSSLSDTPNIFDIIFVDIVKNFTNGAVIIDNVLMKPTATLAILFEYFIANLFGTSSPNTNEK